MPEFDKDAFIKSYAKHAYTFASGKGGSKAPDILDYNNSMQLALNTALIGVMTDDTKATAESLNISSQQFKNWGIAEAIATVQTSYDLGIQEAKKKRSGQER